MKYILIILLIPLFSRSQWKESVDPFTKSKTSVSKMIGLKNGSTFFLVKTGSSLTVNMIINTDAETKNIAMDNTDLYILYANDSVAKYIVQKPILYILPGVFNPVYSMLFSLPATYFLIPIKGIRVLLNENTKDILFKEADAKRLSNYINSLLY